jgi:hypothetical protein
LARLLYHIIAGIFIFGYIKILIWYVVFFQETLGFFTPRSNRSGINLNYVIFIHEFLT